MRILFDIAHPAHVLFYRHMWEELTTRGASVAIASRDKDVTNDLLGALQVPYTSVSRAASGTIGLGIELITRDFGIWRLARQFRPDVILTRSPSGTHVGRLLGVPTIFDTDNGKSAGIHYRVAAPFASVITTPDCFPDDLGPKQVRYPSYKPLAFLHPSRFHPDPGIKVRLGIEPSEDYFLIRLVAMQASHDTHERGLPAETLDRALELLCARGRVFISSESALPEHLGTFRLPTRPDEFLDVVAGASLCLGDSGSVAQEAAILGVPSIFVSTFAGRTAPIEELETRYGLVASFQPSNADDVMASLEECLATPSATYQARHEAMLSDKVDLTSWYIDLVRDVLNRSHSG